MNDHNLDDLIIDTDTNTRHNKTKGFLTLIALVIVVLIAAIVLTKIVLNDGVSTQTNFQDENPFNDPELTLKEDMPIDPALTIHGEEKKKDNTTNVIPKTKPTLVPHQLPIEEPSNPVVPKLEISKPIPLDEEKEKQNLSLPHHNKEVTAPTEKPVNESQTKKPIDKPHRDTPTTEVLSNQTDMTTRPVKQKPSLLKKEHSDHTKITKQNIQQSSTIKKPKPQRTKRKTNIAYHKQYYIQVGSFSKPPRSSSLLLRTLSKNHYPHRVAHIGSMYKVLIGPYPNRKSANRAITRVKDRINKNAFIIAR